MFVTYCPSKYGRQDCEGSTVSILERLEDDMILSGEPIYRVSGTNHDGVQIEWIAKLSELNGFEGE